MIVIVCFVCVNRMLLFSFRITFHPMKFGHLLGVRTIISLQQELRTTQLTFMMSHSFILQSIQQSLQLPLFLQC